MNRLNTSIIYVFFAFSLYYKNNFMFLGVEHKFAVQKHVFTVREHKFNALEHKTYLVSPFIFFA